MEKTTLLEFLQTNQRDIESRLELAAILGEPAGLYDPVKYVLQSPGKRLRPQLCLAAADVFGGSHSTAIEIGAAMEIFHIFTLVHDDIMDGSDSRRGRQTVHVKWDEPTAILTGDYLLGSASALLLALPDQTLRLGLTRFGDTVRALCEGQIRDMTFESRQDVDLDDYLSMIDQKTSALLCTSLVLGALTGQATADDLVLLDQIGHHLGRAFQIQDDLLDLTASSGQWGKPIGGDLLTAKKTFLLLSAIQVERDTESKFFHDMIRDRGLAENKISAARLLLDEMGVLESAQNAVLYHSDQAALLCNRLPDSMGKDAIVSLIDKMAVRSY